MFDNYRYVSENCFKWAMKNTLPLTLDKALWAKIDGKITQDQYDLFYDAWASLCPRMSLTETEQETAGGKLERAYLSDQYFGFTITVMVDEKERLFFFVGKNNGQGMYQCCITGEVFPVCDIQYIDNSTYTIILSFCECHTNRE